MFSINTIYLLAHFHTLSAEAYALLSMRNDFFVDGRLLAQTGCTVKSNDDKPSGKHRQSFRTRVLGDSRQAPSAPPLIARWRPRAANERATRPRRP